MGHADLSNISKFFVNRLYAKGKVTVKECVAKMVEKKMEYEASEGGYKDEYMLGMGLEEVISFLLEDHAIAKDQKGVPVIKCSDLTKEQTAILKRWLSEEGTGNWDEKEYEIFDSIQWKFTSPWRKNFRKVPILGNVTH